MAQKIHRKELKHDEIGEGFVHTVQNLKLHSREFFLIATIAVGIGIVALIWSYYHQRQEGQSQQLLGTALDKFQSDTAPPTDPTAPKPAYTYKSDSEKYADALKDFDQITQKYGHTSSADTARYYAGVCSYYLKDYGKAEQDLKQSGQVSANNLLYYRSRMTLGELYRLTNRPQLAVSTLKEAVDRNKQIVPQESLLMELAESYKAAGDIQNARQTYQQILSQYKDSPVSYKAQTAMSELKSK
jgi:tetratricopeptide (TPR) repeat protein